MPDDTSKTIIDSDGVVVENAPQTLPALYSDPTQIMPFDHSARIALLPERMSWDKKAGKFVAETIETTDLEFRLIGSMLLWALWSDVVGQPLDMIPGEMPPDDNYEAGIRLMIEVEDLGYYYLDLFGLGFKFGQGVVKQAAHNGGLVKIKGCKPISTKNGVFMLPVIVKDGA